MAYWLGNPGIDIPNGTRMVLVMIFAKAMSMVGVVKVTRIRKVWVYVGV